MPLMLLDHGNTGTEMLGEVLYRHPAVMSAPWVHSDT